MVVETSMKHACFYGQKRRLPPDFKFSRFPLVGTLVGTTVFPLVGTTVFPLVGTTVFSLVDTTVFPLVGTTIFLVGTTIVALLDCG